jgi:hypothetical protein
MADVWSLTARTFHGSLQAISKPKLHVTHHPSLLLLSLPDILDNMKRCRTGQPSIRALIRALPIRCKYFFTTASPHQLFREGRSSWVCRPERLFPPASVLLSLHFLVGTSDPWLRRLVRQMAFIALEGRPVCIGVLSDRTELYTTSTMVGSIVNHGIRE